MINKLIEIAQTIEANDLLSNLYELSDMDTNSSPLILPLVGEYNAGKTTLINALTDSKQLEIAIVPTTSTIYQIYFHSDEVFAQIYKDDGSVENIDDISSLKNDGLSGSETVVIFDTSKQVPENIVLVDTPGLSSDDARHKQSLMGFLPKADGILLTVDINQQITRSLTDFIKEMNFAKRRVYLVITKCDTKPASAIEEIKKYICKETKLPIEQIVCVSAKDGNLNELYSLLENINEDKANILKEINEQRVINFAKILSARIDELLEVSFSSDTDIETAKKEYETELRRLKRNINKLIEDIRQSVTSIKDDICRDYLNQILKKIDYMITNEKGANYDEKVLEIINPTTELYFENYKRNIQEILYQKIRERRFSDESINLDTLEELNLDESLQLETINYDLNLNMVGHEYDATISNAAKITIAVAATIPTVISCGATLAGGAAAGTVAAKTAGKAAAKKVTKQATISMIKKQGLKTVTDKAGREAIKRYAKSVATKATLNKLKEEIIKNSGTFIYAGKEIKNAFYANLRKTENLNEKYSNNPLLADSNNSENTGIEPVKSKGFTEMIVSKITDKLSASKRHEAISDYLDNEIIPWFKNNLERICKEFTEIISLNLQNEAEFINEEKINSLNELKGKYEADKERFENWLNSLREYKQDLEMIK